MNFLKKAAAAALSAVMLAGMTLPAYAEADGTAPVSYTHLTLPTSDLV